MKIKLRRLLIFLLAAVLSLSVLAGCGQQEEQPVPEEPAEGSDSEGFWNGEVEDFDFDVYKAEHIA